MALYLNRCDTNAWLKSPFGTYLADSSHQIHISIKSTAENLYFGFAKPFFPDPSLFMRIRHNGVVVWGPQPAPSAGGQPGTISSHTQAISGPNILNPSGYPPLVFHPTEPGDYTIEFTTNDVYRTLDWFDLTVIDTTIHPYVESKGRVWSRGWQFNSCCGFWSGIYSTMFIRTQDSMIDSIYFNSMNTTDRFELNFNSNGCLPPPASWETGRKSRYDRHLYPEYQIFLNNPDSSLFPSGIAGMVVHDSSNIQYNCTGQYIINFYASKSGNVIVQLDLNPLPGYQTEDVIFNQAVHAGWNSVLWNGLNGLGIPVPATTAINVIFTFINGLVNFPIGNCALNDTGFIVGTKRPALVQPKLYWNDTLVPGGLLQLDGCQGSAISGCRTWHGCCTDCSPMWYGWGTGKTINTWWYSGVSDTIRNMSLLTQVATADSIHGVRDTCFTSGRNYTYTVFPHPLPGATGYTWKLFSGTTNIQTWNTPTATNNNISFPGPGLFSIIAGGYNLCGPGTFDTISILIHPASPVSIGISASQNPVCAGTPVTFTASAQNPGNSPVYQWMVNGLNSGANSTSFSYAPVNGDAVSCRLTSSITDCVSGNPATSNSVVMTVDPPLTASISIATPASSVCAGSTVVFTATAANPGSSPVFQWTVNGAPAGTNSNVFSYMPANGDVVNCTLTSSITSCIANNPASSNTVTMTVNPLMPVSISTAASANPICAGIPVTFTATPVNPGNAPQYLWKVNGIAAGTNSSAFTYIPVNSDEVTCELTSSLTTCVSGNPAISLPINMTVNPLMPVSISIAASANPVCAGSPVTFTATPVNPGNAPVYLWKVNGIAAGTNSSAFTYVPLNGDAVTCELSSSLACVTGNPANGNPVSLSVKPLPYVSFTSCYDTITILTAQPFKLAGGVPPGGIYSGPGVNSATSYFNPALAGTGIKTITYTCQNQFSCIDIKSRTITVQAASFAGCGSMLTDIRDGSAYPTILLGTQCWMGKNLDYGNSVSGLVHQSDNCVPEKYCYNNSTINCGLFGGLYQWDELMRYQSTPGSQGICPPGWHVPTQADWLALFNFYQDQGLAGKPLQDSIIVGFRAKEGGVIYSNSSWNFQGFATIFWSSTPSGAVKAMSHGMNLQNFGVSDYKANRSNAFSLRCIKD